jgi:D-alanyl-D-alanine carboxypeptidase
LLLHQHTAIVEANGTLMDGASTAIVPWWSFTKSLIAVAVLRLAEQGRLALDVPLDDFPCTPRDLLQHRAGVADYSGIADYHAGAAQGDTPWSESELLQRVLPDRLLFKPRSHWAYSNVGYFLLRRLVERTCGTDLSFALHDLVLAPLGLTSARLAQSRSDMHITAFAGGRTYDPGWVFHGLVIGPVAEAALALHRLLRSDLIGPASRAALTDCYPIGQETIAGRPWVTTGYGLGLMMGTMQHPRIEEPLKLIGHTGAGPGSVGAVYHAPDDRWQRTIAVFTSGADQGLVEQAMLEQFQFPRFS